MASATSIGRRLGVLLLGVLFLQLVHAEQEDKQQRGQPLCYFRSDLGVAPKNCGRLPDDLALPSALLWRVAIASGQSSPIVCGDKVFLTTYGSDTKELATEAIETAKGQNLWKTTVPAPRIEVYHPQTGSAAVATPACDGSRLFVFFGSYGLLCYDLRGTLLWEHRMGPFRDEYGAGSSPILFDDKVVLCQDHDIDSFVIAVDRSTGKTLWKVPRPDAVRSYSTPAIWHHAGRAELLVAGALELEALDPVNGERLWSTHGLARIVIPTPIPMNDTIFMASWAPGGDPGKRLALDAWLDALAKWDKNKNGRLTREEIDDREVLDRFARMDLDQSGDLNQREWERHAAVFRQAQNAVLAIRPSGKGEQGEQAVEWKYQRGVPYVSTPLVNQGILWMVKDGGFVTKLDIANGQLLQEERLPGPGNYYASPVAGDGKVYFASEQGVVSILGEERDWKIVSSHNLREKIYATPCIDHGRIYVRTEKALYCFKGE